MYRLIKRIDEYDWLYSAQQKYAKTHTRQIGFVLNTKTDKDILDWLDEKPNKQGYIKGLIRDDIEKNGE